jgi:hypothetical protein
MIHELKTWPRYFQMVLNGSKRFELRKDDRKYQPGDYLHLREYVPKDDRYTGEELVVMVNDVIRNLEVPGLSEGYCIMSLGTTVI